MFSVFCRPLTKNYEIVHLHPTVNVSHIRAVWSEEESSLADPPPWNNSTSTNRTDTSDELPSLPPYEAAIVFGMNEIVLTNLKHYQEYNIEVCTLFVLREMIRIIMCHNCGWLLVIYQGNTSYCV